MNPISVVSGVVSAFELLQTIAPMVPNVVKDAQVFVADMDRVIADIKAKDASATFADIEASFANVETDIGDIAKVAQAGKGLVAAATA